MMVSVAFRTKNRSVLICLMEVTLRHLREEDGNVSQQRHKDDEDEMPTVEGAVKKNSGRRRCDFDDAQSRFARLVTQKVYVEIRSRRKDLLLLKHFYSALLPTYHRTHDRLMQDGPMAPL